MRVRLFVSLAVLALGAEGLMAQQETLGTFRWQLRPYCNVLTLTVVRQGTRFHVDGTDDLCSASRHGAVVGRAFQNPNGSIGLGLVTVTTTGAVGVHIDAVIDLTSVSGTWTDSVGNTGQFVFTSGIALAGSLGPSPPTVSRRTASRPNSWRPAA